MPLFLGFDLDTKTLSEHMDLLLFSLPLWLA